MTAAPRIYMRGYDWALTAANACMDQALIAANVCMDRALIAADACMDRALLAADAYPRVGSFNGLLGFP